MAATELTWIVEISLPSSQAIHFQNLLEAEEGLAVMRCLGTERSRQQLWTTPCQRHDLMVWLESLPESIHWQWQREWQWGDKAAGS